MEAKRQESDAHVVTPPDNVFARGHVINDSMFGAETTFNVYERTETPPEGGIYAYYKGVPFPKKGFPTPESTWMNDVVKRITVFFIRSLGTKDMIIPAVAFAPLPWKSKMRTIERGLYNFNRVALWMFQSIILKDERYSNPCRSMRKLIEAFLLELKVSPQVCKDFALIMATMFEYDDSYRYRFEDMMSETSRGKLIEKPMGEFRRLIALFRSREKFTDMMDKLDGIEAIGSVALLHPKVRRAFRAAFGSLNAQEFDMMKLDDADKYHTLIRGDYDFQGKSLETRVRRLALIHTTSKCHGAPVVLGGYCQKCKQKCETDFNPPPKFEIKK